MVPIKPVKPLKLEGNLSKKWMKWKTNFMIFLHASNLEVQPSKIKTKLLLHLIGQPARDIHQSFALSKKQRKDFETTIGRFDEYFSCIRNSLTVFRCQLFTARQQQKESIDEFYTRLKILSSKCELATLEESLLTDLLILGLKDGRLQKKLLSRKDISLKTVLKQGRICDRICSEKTSSKSEKTSSKSERRNQFDKNGNVHYNGDTKRNFKGDNDNSSTKEVVKNRIALKDSGVDIKLMNRKNSRNSSHYGDNFEDAYRKTRKYKRYNNEDKRRKCGDNKKIRYDNDTKIHYGHNMMIHCGDNVMNLINSQNVKSVESNKSNNKGHVKSKDLDNTKRQRPLSKNIDDSLSNLIGGSNNLRTKFKKLSHCSKGIKTIMLDQIDGIKKRDLPHNYSNDTVIIRTARDDMNYTFNHKTNIIRSKPSPIYENKVMRQQFDPKIINNAPQENKKTQNTNNYHDTEAQRDITTDQPTSAQTPSSKRKLIFAAMNYSSEYLNQQKHTSGEKGVPYTDQEVKVVVTAAATGTGNEPCSSKSVETSTPKKVDRDKGPKKEKQKKEGEGQTKRESVSSASLQIKLYKMI